MKTFIYALQDPITLEIRYIGKSNNPKQRLKAHCNPARFTSTHKFNWIQSLRKKGLKPIMIVVDEVSIDEWHYWERYWIEQMAQWGFNLVNTTRGGDGLTQGNQTSFKKGHSVWLGKKHSKESRNKMSINNHWIGKQTPNSKIVHQLNLYGDFIAEYPSAHEAARKTNSCNSKVSAVCRGERKTHNNFKWKYK